MDETIKKITVKANPKCKSCLGSGMAMGLYAGVTFVCPCVTEQLRIVTVEKDYTIKDRYTPGQPDFVKLSDLECAQCGCSLRPDGKCASQPWHNSTNSTVESKQEMADFLADPENKD